MLLNNGDLSSNISNILKFLSDESHKTTVVLNNFHEIKTLGRLFSYWDDVSQLPSGNISRLVIEGINLNGNAFHAFKIIYNNPIELVDLSGCNLDDGDVRSLHDIEGGISMYKDQTSEEFIFDNNRITDDGFMRVYGGFSDRPSSRNVSLSFSGNLIGKRGLEYLGEYDSMCVKYINLDGNSITDEMFEGFCNKFDESEGTSVEVISLSSNLLTEKSFKRWEESLLRAKNCENLLFVPDVPRIIF